MDRRNFLTRGCAAIAATSFIGNMSVFASETKSGADIIPFKASDTDGKLDTPVKVAVIGYGGRGQIYAGYALSYPGSVNIVGVADINDYRAILAKTNFGIEQDKVFGDWSEMFNVPKFADAVVIALPDALHHKCTMKALECGYNVLLEKPVAQTEGECLDILAKTKETGLIVGVCHVLRYAPYFQALKEVVDSGEIGNLVSIQHFEAVEAVHMSHSFVRGNWSNSKIATPMIISKSCHDLDILRWLVGRKCEKVSAFGSLALFKKECAPEGASKRCMDGCKVESTCPFSAKHIYIEQGQWLHVFDNLYQNAEERKKQITQYLATTDYGKCVYFSNNDQCDNYTMNMSFEGGTNVGFQMEGLTSYGNRHTRIQGTKGDITGNMNTFTVTDFRSRRQRVFNAADGDGHGGGDWRLMRDFVRAVAADDASLLTSSIDASVESHLMGFAAEKSRYNSEIVKL